jgi:general stress protein CsbA
MKTYKRLLHRRGELELDSWIIELLFAIIAPFTLVALFTRVTYNKWVAMLLALGMLIFVMKAFERDWLTIVIGLASLTLGALYSYRLDKKYNRRWK